MTGTDASTKPGGGWAETRALDARVKPSDLKVARSTAASAPWPRNRAQVRWDEPDVYRICDGEGTVRTEEAPAILILVPRARPGSNRTIPVGDGLYASAVTASPKRTPYRRYGWTGVIRDKSRLYWRCPDINHARYQAINCAASHAWLMAGRIPRRGVAQPRWSERQPVGKRSAIAGLSEQVWQELVAASNGCCHYCGRKDGSLVREHRVPLSRGGTNEVSNIVPACPECNRVKGSLTEVEFAELLRRLGYRKMKERPPGLLSRILAHVRR